MPLGDAYQESTDRTIAVMASAPLEPEKPKAKHSAWSTIPRAVAGAFTETAGNILDTASAFGQVAAAAGGIGPGFDPDARKNRPQVLEAYDRLKTEGIDWRPEVSRPQYEFSRDLRPDPLTAGAAENIIFGLTKGLTKAVGAGMVLGPAGGAAAFGASEGMTTADDLAAEGVDLATRTKVGAVTAGLNTVGMALPVAGKTVAGTIGLAVTGGPASFIAQQQATRSILENADYGELAQQYDPLDPVGLTIATLLPAGFGAWAMRGRIRAGQPKAAPADPTAEPVTENAATAPETAPAVTQDQVDAAMVQNLTVARDVNQAVAITEKNEGTWIQAESPFGSVGGTVEDGTLRITFAEVLESERGKGHGMALYTRLIDEAFSRGLRVTSDATVEMPAVRVYEALARRGYQVDRLPGGGELPPDDIAPMGGLFGAGADSPVFSVGPKADDVARVDSLVAKVEAMREIAPDMPVALKEDGTPATLADELDAIRRQVQEGTDEELGAMDADLLRVAAECALTVGA